MPLASDISIKLNGVDITNKVVFAPTRFERQQGAIPGIAEVLVKDVDQTFDATTGDELTLDLDGVREWGGLVLNVARLFALPVVDTTDFASVTARQFRLTAVDYNILFDKRVIRNTADYLHALPFFTLDKTMGELLRTQLFASYLDISGDGLDTTTYVDDTFVPHFDADGNPDPDATKKGSWPQQGSYWRKAMEDFSQFGTIYYIDGAKNVHFHEAEVTVATWGFSDVPNNLPLPNAAARYGMREYEDVEDGSAMANDALVWGGSEWAGSSGGTVFSRKQNATSISEHGRWQYSEVRFGELKNQGMVTARANVIVSGNTTGAVGGDTSRGLSVDQKQVRLAWFGHDVPSQSGIKQHLQPGQVVTIDMFVMTENGIDPLTLILPLRQVKITFPTIPADGSPADPLTYVRFDGFFGVQLSDPWWMWKLLRDLASQKPSTSVAVADATTDATVYGALGSFAPTPTPDGSTTVFTIPFAYIAGTTQVYKGPTDQLALQTPGVDYTESDPTIGEITFTSPPSGTSSIWVICRVAGGI